MPAGDGGGGARDEVQEREAEPRARCEEGREGRHDPRGHQGDDEARNRDPGQRNGDEVGDDTDRRDRPEGERRDRRREKRGGHGWTEQPGGPRQALERAAGPHHPGHRGDREPRPHRLRRPGIDEEEQQHKKKKQPRGRHHTLAPARAGIQQEQDDGPRRGRGSAEQPHIGGECHARGAQAARPAHADDAHANA